MYNNNDDVIKNMKKQLKIIGTTLFFPIACYFELIPKVASLVFIFVATTLLGILPASMIYFVIDFISINLFDYSFEDTDHQWLLICGIMFWLGAYLAIRDFYKRDSIVHFMAEHFDFTEISTSPVIAAINDKKFGLSGSFFFVFDVDAPDTSP